MADVTSPFGFPYPEDTDLVRDGASDIENLAEGVNDYLTGGYLYAGTRYYTSSGTFAKADPLGTGDIGLRAIRVTVVGGGGSGSSGSSPYGGHGAGGAATAVSFITNIAGLDSSITVTRGAGAAGNPDAQGTDGAASSFGTLVVANGGGNGRSADAGFGGDGGTGDIIYGGGSGAVGSRDVVFDASRTSYSGVGGTSHLGGGGRGLGPSNVNDGGNVGRLYGGGGSGARNPSGTNVSGGAGANGIVIVDCFV
jgi:hypothetical protein